MKSFSMRIASPLVFILALLIVKSAEDGSYKMIIFGIVVFLAIIYILHPQIDLWWAKRNPPTMNPKLEFFLRQHFGFYARLSPQEQERFRNRLMIYMMDKEFIYMTKEEKMPEDVRVLITAQILQLTFGLEEYLTKDFDRIVIYKHAFGTPELQFLHSSEIHLKDGVTIFDLERTSQGIFDNKHYNLILHEYGNIFRIQNPNIIFPDFDENIWETLAEIRGFDKEYIINFIGKPEVNAVQVSIEHFFKAPQHFDALLPKIYEEYVRIFNQDPLEVANRTLLINEIV